MSQKWHLTCTNSVTTDLWMEWVNVIYVCPAWRTEGLDTTYISSCISQQGPKKVSRSIIRPSKYMYSVSPTIHVPPVERTSRREMPVEVLGCLSSSKTRPTRLREKTVFLSIPTPTQFGRSFRYHQYQCLPSFLHQPRHRFHCHFCPHRIRNCNLHLPLVRKYLSRWSWHSRVVLRKL